MMRKVLLKVLKRADFVSSVMIVMMGILVLVTLS